MTAILNRVRDARRTSDAGFAMLMALFIIGVIATVSLAVAGVVLNQVKPSQHDAKTARTVEAAQAGFDSAQNVIRAATTDGTNGLIGMLPCSVNGSVGGTKLGSATTFTVTVAYYDSDPTSHLTNSATDSTWRSSHNITCTPGSGTASTPSYAILTAAGKGTAVAGDAANVGNRKLQTVLQLPTTNQHIVGGPLRAYNYTTLCMDGGDSSDNVKAGNTVYLRTCDSTKQGQKFSYTSDLFLQLVGTTSSHPLLCLQATASTNAIATLANCSATTATQLWSFTGNRTFQASNANRTDIQSGYCLGTKSTSSSSDVTPANGVRIGVTGTCSFAVGHSWLPDSTVGAGAAGTAQGQLVNYQYFGNCLDITNVDPTWSFLIGYPCKQNPNPSKLDWNQLWSYNSSAQQWVATSGSTTYCLQAGSNSSPPSAGALVLTKTCNSGEQYQKWISTGNIDGDYADSYQIKLAKNTNLCLQLTQPAPANLTSQEGPTLIPWGYISVENCTASLNQKWNAPPYTPSPQLLNTYEQANS